MPYHSQAGKDYGNPKRRSLKRDLFAGLKTPRKVHVIAYEVANIATLTLEEGSHWLKPKEGAVSISEDDIGALDLNSLERLHGSEHPLQNEYLSLREVQFYIHNHTV